jgi:hypothetical protein
MTLKTTRARAPKTGGRDGTLYPAPWHCDVPLPESCPSTPQFDRIGMLTERQDGSDMPRMTFLQELNHDVTDDWDQNEAGYNHFCRFR